MNRFTFIQLILGAAEAEITAASPELYLNECTRLGLPFRVEAKADECTLRIHLRQSDVGRAEEAARRCGCDFRLLEKRGGAAALGRLKGQLGFCLAALTLMLLLFASSLFIWDIRVAENPTELADEAILAVLDEIGVGVGRCWVGMSSDMIRAAALQRLPELSYITVNVHGSRAEVLVRGKDAVIEPRDENTPADIRAARGGIITEMRVLEGEQLAAVGDTVLPGDILVSAQRNGRSVHAEAEVTARTWREMTACVPLTELRTQPEGLKKQRWGLILGKRRVNFSINSGIHGGTCDKITQIWPLEVPGVFRLPLAIFRETRQDLRCVETERDKAAAEAALRSLLRQRMLSELCEGEILTERFTVSEGAGLLYVTLRCECLERIDREEAVIP